MAIRIAGHQASGIPADDPLPRGGGGKGDPLAEERGKIKTTSLAVNLAMPSHTSGTLVI
jgi:hypothetical protein